MGLPLPLVVGALSQWQGISYDQHVEVNWRFHTQSGIRKEVSTSPCSQIQLYLDLTLYTACLGG